MALTLARQYYQDELWRVERNLRRFSMVLGRLATVLGRFDEAAEHFEVALEGERRLGARVREASTQVAYARMLLARDDGRGRSEARARLKEGAALAGELGAFLHHESAVSVLTGLET